MPFWRTSLKRNAVTHWKKLQQMPGRDLMLRKCRQSPWRCGTLDEDEGPEGGVEPVEPNRKYRKCISCGQKIGVFCAENSMRSPEGLRWLEQTATLFYDFSWMQNCSKYRAYFLLRSSVCQLLRMSLFLSPARFVLTWPVHSLSPLSSHVFSWPDMFRDMDHTGSVCSHNPWALLRSAEICWGSEEPGL